MIMKDNLSKVTIALVYVIVGMVIGYVLAMGRCKKEDPIPEIKNYVNEHLEKLTKQAQEFEEKLKELTEKSKKE